MFEIIPFKHSSTHRVSISVYFKGFRSEDFHKNVELMQRSWPNVKVDFDWKDKNAIIDERTEIVVTFEHNHAGIVEEAAHQFVKYVRKFDWWREVPLDLSYKTL